jgi:Niemann-Pick C1 protein
VGTFFLLFSIYWIRLTNSLTLNTQEMLDIIKKELIRNVLLCLVAVLIITMILIAHPMTAFLVFLCVMLTLIDVLGFMHFWGLAIDNVTVINANLAVGLSVDYAAHIGHHFMVSTGTRRERVRKSLSEMGAPVFNGAFSTFLAVSLLGVSQSYVFIAMFKQFFLTVIFGVMHGLIFLPIALLYLGPQSNYDNDGSSSSSSAIEMSSD